MADIQSNIQVNLDATQALAQLKALQRQLAQFHTSIASSTAAAAKAQANLQDNLINSINATGKFAASLQQIKSTSESFTESLEKNKFSTREYFRYAGGATKTFGRLFKTEFDTIGKVAEERVKTMQTQYVKMGRAANGAIKAIAVRPLTLDMESLATKTALAAQKQQLFNQLLKQGSTNLLNFGKNTQWAGRQLMVGFTIPLTMLGTQAAKSFMALEKQALRFKRVYGEMFTTTEQTEKALKEIEMLAKEFTKYGIAVEKTMEIAADAAATGKMGADLMAQVAEATRLAVLGGVEQQQALETTLSLTNAFGIEADKLASKINFLNAVENQTVLSIEDLTVAIPKAGPVIKQLGGDVEDLAFFMTAMKEGGINASEGANALKSGLASLINPSDKAAGFLEELGINIKGIVEANKGDVKGTVIGFAQALDTLDPLNRARAIEQLFGKFQFSRLSTLFQNVTKDSTQAARALNLTGASVEELAILSERELKKVEDATGTKFKKAIEDLKVRLVPLGEQFLKAVTPIAEFFSKILNGFNNLSDGVKSGITKFIGIVGIIGPAFLMTFGLIANAVANAIKLFATLRKGYFNLGGQSKILGNQTNYMTSEQIEAATVAASLDQAHSRLKQSFLLEKDALVLLTQAYQRANIAAGNFARVNPGSMRPGFTGRGPRRFNKGGFVRRAGGTVPGTGNTDTVPAMLTPGEFVVNKKATQSNKGLLQKLNDGGVALRGGGTEDLSIIKPGGVLGTALLHYDDATSNKDVATHRSGELSGFRKGSGYLMLGDQGYNNLTNSISTALKSGDSKLYNSLKALPNPYPLTVEDAQKANILINEKINELNEKVLSGKKLNIPEQKMLRMLTVSAAHLKTDLKIMPSATSWKEGMAERTAAATALAEGEKYPPEGKIFKQIKAEHMAASRNAKSTEEVKKIWTKKVNDLWSKGALTDQGMGTGGRKSGKKGTLHLRPKTTVQDFMGQVSQSKTFKSIKGLTRIATSPSKKVRGFIDSPIIREIKAQGYKPRVIRAVRAKGTPQFGEPSTVPALVTPGEMVLNEKTTQQYGPALQYVNSGGIIKMRGKGTMKNGIVPGVGNKDTVPMMLNEGSFVVNKKSTQKNRGFLNSIAMRADGTDDPFADIGVPASKGSAEGVGKNIGRGALSVLKTGGKAVGKAIVSAGFSKTARDIQADMDEEYVQSKSDRDRLNNTLPSLRGESGRLTTTGVISTEDLQQQEDDLAFQEKNKKDIERAERDLQNSKKKIHQLDRRIAQAVANGDKERAAALKAQKAAAVQERKNAGTALNDARQIAKQRRENAAIVTQQSIASGPVDSRGNKELRRSKRFQSELFNIRQKGGQYGTKETGRQFGQRAGGAMMGATMAVGALTAVPGKTGEIAQAAMPMVGMASLLAPMMGSKMGAIAAPIAAFTAAMVALNMQFNKAQDAALKLGEATGTSTKAIQAFAEFTGRVTGTELMDRQREAAKTPFAIQTGKTTVGQAYVQTEAGKATIAGFQETLKTRGREQAQKDLQAQLGTSILSGALSSAEASSIAANIGLQLGDASVGLKVAGELQALYNTKGDDVLKTGVELRTKLMEESSRKVIGPQGSIQDLSKKSAGFAGINRNVNVGGQVLAGAGIGAGIGTLVAGPVGALVGTAIGGIVGGVSAYFTNKKNVKKLGAISGAAVADAVGMFEQSRQLLDSYEQQYQAKKQQLLVENKIAEATKLQRDYEAGRLKITKMQEEQRRQLGNEYAGTTGESRKALDKGLLKAARTRYKGTAQEAYVDFSNELINESVGKGVTQADAGVLRTMMASGELDPSGVQSLLKTVTDVKDRQIAMEIVTKFGGDETSAAMGVIGMFNPKGDQTLLKEIKTDFLVQLNSKSEKDAQPYIEMMQKFSALGGVIQLDTEFNSIVNNPEEQKELSKDLQMIEDKKGKFDLNFLQKVDTRFAEGAVDMKYLDALTEDQQKIYTTAIRGILSVDLNTTVNSPEYQAWLKEKGPRGGAQYDGQSTAFLVNKYAESIGYSATQAGIAMGTAAATTTPTTPKTKKPRDTTYDEMLKKIKLFQNANANAIGGIKEVRRLMESPGKTMKLDGVVNQLTKSGRFSTEFTDMIKAMSPEELQKNMKKFGLVLKKGKLEFTKDARDINKILAFGISGERVAESQEQLAALQRKISAVNVLRRKSVDHENAMIIAQDDAVNMAILNGTFNEKQLNARIKATKALTKAEKEFQRVQSIQLQDRTMRNAMTGDAMMEYFDLMVKANDAAYVRQKTEIELIDQKNGYLLEQISYEENIINKVYDKQIEKLDAIYKLQEDINQSQRERFDIIQQIATGDMAGAARAIQDARQREALAQIEKKRQAVEEQRKKAIEGVTAGGRTRQQIEDENIANAKKMNDINIQAFDQLMKIRDFITQLTNKTPEQLQAYSDLAAAAQKLGLDMNKVNVESAINASVQGKADAFLTMLEKKATTLFDKILGTDKTDYLGKTNKDFVKLPNDAIAPVAFWGGDPKAVQGQGNYVLDPNTIATNENTKALGAVTEAIKGWLPAGTGSKGGKGGKGSKGGTTNKTSPSVSDMIGSKSPTAIDYAQGSKRTYGNVTDWTDAAIAKAEKETKDYSGPGGYKRAQEDRQNQSDSKAVTVKTSDDFQTIIVGKKAVTVPKDFGFSSGGLVPKYMSKGGMTKPLYRPMGGLIPYFLNGGFAKGTDTVPAMLTPGEFVVRKSAVDSLGIDTMQSINKGEMPTSNSVYNYNLSVNVSSSNANPNDIARVVINQIKQIDSQRIRSSR